MAQREVKEFIESKVDTTIPGSGNVKFENKDFTEPNNNKWYKVSVIILPVVNASLGSSHPSNKGVFLRQGLVQVDGFTPEGRGTNTVTDTLELVRKAFEFQHFTLTSGDHLDFDTAVGPRGIGSTGTGKYMQTLELPFWWQEFPANS